MSTTDVQIKLDFYLISSPFTLYMSISISDKLFLLLTLNILYTFQLLSAQKLTSSGNETLLNIILDRKSSFFTEIA